MFFRDDIRPGLERLATFVKEVQSAGGGSGRPLASAVQASVFQAIISFGNKFRSAAPLLVRTENAGLGEDVIRLVWALREEADENSRLMKQLSASLEKTQPPVPAVNGLQQELAALRDQWVVLAAGIEEGFSGGGLLRAGHEWETLVVFTNNMQDRSYQLK